MQSILFSVYCGLTVSICYKLSRGSSNPTVLWNMIKSDVFRIKPVSSNDDGIVDPLPEKLKIIVKQRLQSDILLCFLIFILVFAAHASTTFTSLQVRFSPSVHSTSFFFSSSSQFLIILSVQSLLSWESYFIIFYHNFANNYRGYYSVNH